MKLKMKWFVVFAVAFAAQTFFAWGVTPVIEVPGRLLTAVQKVQGHSQKNLQENKKRLELLKEWKKKLMDISDTTKKMANVGLDRASGTLKNPKGSTLDFRLGGAKTLQALIKIELASHYLSVMDSKVKVAKQITEPPVWMPPTKASWTMRRSNLVLRVSGAQQMQHAGSHRLTEAFSDAAQSLLPGEILNRFNPRQAVSHFLGKIGVREVVDGIFVRPSAPQDSAFTQFANLASDDDDSLLFWSDPIVVSGYHPLLGTMLNSTPLRGYKLVDMDSVASRGHSSAIDKWNRLQPPENRMANPFRGYASRVMPGLISMSARGMLTPGETPTDAQLQEAMQLTSRMKILPSQIMAKKTKAIAGDRVISSLPQFHFSYPARPTPTAGGGTNIVELPTLERKAYKRDMILVKKRIEEIAKLKDETLRGRKYADEIVNTYLTIEQQAAKVAKGMNQDSAIPQITQFRRDLLLSIETFRGVLSELEHRLDDLKHREWQVLNHGLEVRRKAIYYLMDNAAIRWRAVETGKDI